MKKFVLFFAIVAIVSAQECGKLQSGSIEDKNVQLPWAVQLLERKTNDILCMGTLISAQHVLIGNY